MPKIMFSPDVLLPQLFSILRAIAGFALTLFIPGFAFTLALFPRRTELDTIERIALSFVLSISSVLIVVLFIDIVLHIPTTAYYITISLLSFTSLCLILFAIQFLQVPQKTLHLIRLAFHAIYARFPAFLRIRLSSIHFERRVIKRVEHEVESREAYLESIRPDANLLRRFEIDQEGRALKYLDRKASDKNSALLGLRSELRELGNMADLRKKKLNSLHRALSEGATTHEQEKELSRIRQDISLLDDLASKNMSHEPRFPDTKSSKTKSQKTKHAKPPDTKPHKTKPQKTKHSKSLDTKPHKAKSSRTRSKK